MKARKVKGLDPAAPLRESAARIVAVRLAELRSFGAEALEPEAAVAQHDLRIAAKRVRYLLETTGFCFGAPAAGALGAARELQDLLGAIHDVDVMLPRLREHRRQVRLEDAEILRAKAAGADDLEPELAARARHRTAYRGLELLEVYLLARRALLFERFRALWRRQLEERVWESLERAADLERPAG